MKLKKEAAPRMPKEAREFEWTTLEGRKLLLGDIEDRHLFNICGLLLRREKEVGYLRKEMRICYIGDQGDVECIGGLESASQMMHVDLAHTSIRRSLRIVKGELLRRGLRVPQEIR